MTEQAHDRGRSQSQRLLLRALVFFAGVAVPEETVAASSAQHFCAVDREDKMTVSTAHALC